jgi:mannosyl-3-phosphoglycerate phosphatase
MEKASPRGGSSSPVVLIFSDLDGTLLDHDSYSWAEAEEALDFCRSRHIPLILASSKTRAEMDLLRRELRIDDPFISENGGGIFIPETAFGRLADAPPAPLESGLYRVSLGTSYGRLVESLRSIAVELGWKIRGFSEMNLQEISRLTGLSEEASGRAAMREFDEPFIIAEPERPPLAPLLSAAADRGLTISSGGRFYHLQGGNDKGLAMGMVLSWYQNSVNEVLSIALGDSPNDFAMLQQADYPVLIRSGQEFPELHLKIPRLEITRERGPRGWNSAVLNILGKKIGGR